jgi:hypothetical protein
VAFPNAFSLQIVQANFIGYECNALCVQSVCIISLTGMMCSALATNLNAAS